MNEQWDERLLKFIKRTSEEIKTETQRLVAEVKDPETQRKMKESLREFGTWAKQTAEEAADMIGSAVKKAEAALSQTIDKGPTSTSKEQKSGREPQVAHPPTPASSSGPSRSKSMGKSKKTGAKKARPTASSKSIGRKR
jgi:hypothetical protein